MPAPLFSDPVQPLLRELARWDELAGVLETHGPRAALSTRDRATLILELERVAAEYGAAAAPRGRNSLRSLWRRVFGSPDGLMEACTRSEERVLRAYEALCERELPFSIANLLLRQHDQLKRAIHRRRTRPVSWRPKRHTVAKRPSAAAPA